MRPYPSPQHMNYPNKKQQTLLDDIINTVNELVYRAVNAIEGGLRQTPPASLGFTTSQLPPETLQQSTEARGDALAEIKQTEVDTGIIQLESLLNATVDKDFDKFEIYTLRNILAVGHEDEAGELANWMQLDHYKNLNLSGSDARPTPEEVSLQRRKLQETVKLNAMLSAEEKRNEAVLAQLKGMLGQTNGDSTLGPALSFLQPPSLASKSSRDGLMEQNVQYTLSQLPALKDLLTQLKSGLQSIPNARDVHEDETSREAKRRRYLDTQARRAMERKGISSDAGHGAARSGRKIGKDEVEGMEAVVRTLGGPGPGQGHGDEMEE